MIRKMLLLTSLLVCMLPSLLFAGEVINLNRNWKFSLGDFTQASENKFPDNEWISTHLPHSFSIPYFMWKDVYSGYGWYRKEIVMPPQWKGKQISIEFEGVFIQCEVFLNGKKIGEHVGGYTGFNYDLTPFMKLGKNLLAVRVNNIWKAGVAPRAGDHQFSGGIYRDVYLHIKNPLHIAWNGTAVSTPVVSKQAATIEVQTEINNRSTEPQTLVMRTEIVSPAGVVVTKTESKATLTARSNQIISQKLPSLSSPQLWHPTTPYLYTAISTILKDGKETDRTETTFGIRWFEWTADKGFFLNGEHLYLLGANVHQDHAGWGDAVTNTGFYRDVKLMKEAGFNTIRGSHYPHDPAFSKACDELGILFFPENAFWGMGGSSGDRFGWITPSSSCYPPHPSDQDAFDQSVLSQLKELILIHRNSPSITAWSLSNEAFFTDDPTEKRMKALLNAATDSVHKWDPTRLVAIGGCQRRGLDQLGKNQIAFYNGDGATFAAPGVPSMVSEYGSVTTHRPGKFAPGWGDLEDGFNRPQWRGGQIIWCGFDHGTVGGEGLATMGLVDYFRIPKRAWYWYQSAYAKGESTPSEPQWAQPGIPSRIKLTADKMTLSAPDGTDDTQILITIIDNKGQHISNEIPVTLRIKSGPGTFPTGNSIQFMPPSDKEASDISIRDGMAAIEFRSYHAGTTIIEATAQGLPTTTLKIVTLGTPTWESEGKPTTASLPYKRFHLVDKTPMTGNGELLLAKNRPSAVSSTSELSSKGLANDGDEQSSWFANITDKNPWWRVDLEASYDLNTIQLIFPLGTNCRYIVEVSSDIKTWQQIAEGNKALPETKTQIFKGNLGNNIRSVRIRFTQGAGGLSEVKIGGTPSSK
ncbi:MAG: glycoside hydrolase family 2 TIM barrel-domain containing protein [Bacteroides sp.]|uniref:glycoside hydrolase family 2 protein n=1 Tax=Bacteroides sp. TaxID=29523 RepID=UPI002FC91A4B